MVQKTPKGLRHSLFANMVLVPILGIAGETEAHMVCGDIFL